MNLRLPAFILGLVAVFAAAVLVGHAWGPSVEVESHQEGHQAAADGHPSEGDHAHDGGADPGPASVVELRLEHDQVSPGATVAFTLRDRDGTPITAYQRKHEKLLHLIAVDRDSLTTYRHVHPELAPDGRWTADLDLGPGTFELYADGQPVDGAALVARAQLTVAGSRPGPSDVPAPTVLTRTDGYDVALLRTDGRVSFSVSSSGRPVAPQPYLGAKGHLVVIDTDGLDYVHAHPVDDVTVGPEVSFEVDLEPGHYRAFLDFRHGGAVHTAAYTVHVPGAGAPEGADAETHEEDGHAH